MRKNLIWIDFNMDGLIWSCAYYYYDLRKEKIIKKRRQMSGSTDLGGIEYRDKTDI